MEPENQHKTGNNQKNLIKFSLFVDGVKKDATMDN